MEPFALSGLLAGISSLVFGVLVLVKSPNRLAGRIWFVFALSVAGWGFGDFILPSIKDEQIAVIGWKITYAASANWIAVLFYHFVTVFLGLKRRWILLSQYSIALLFFFLAPTGLIYSGVWRVVGDFYYSKAGPLYIINSGWWLALVFFSHFEMLMAYKTLSPLNRLQVKYFFLATVVGFSGGSFSFLPPLGFTLYPWGNFSIFLYPLIMSYAIVQFRLMDINLAFRYATVRILFALAMGVPLVAVVLYFNSILLASVLLFLTALVWPLLYARLGASFMSAVDRLPPFRGRYDRLTYVHDHVRKLHETKDVKNWASQLAHSIASLLQIERVSVLIWEPAKRYYLVQGSVGLDHAQTIFLSLASDSPVIKYLSREKDVLVGELIPRVCPPEEVEGAQSDMNFLLADVTVPIFVGIQLRAIVNLGPKMSGQMLNDLEIGSLLHLASGAGQALRVILSGLSSEQTMMEWAHDLRHPFGPKGGLQHVHELLKRGHSMPEDMWNKLRAIRDDIVYVGKHLDEILQPEATEVKYNIVLGPMKNIYERLREDYRVFAEEKGIEWIVNIPGNEITVFRDEESVKYRVIPNYLNNAFRLTPRGGRIELGFKTDASAFIGFVRDTGPGMSPDIKGKVFARGVQGEKSSRGAKGLGLYNVKTVIESQKGSVWVESEVGHGSTFYFSLPLGWDNSSPEITHIKREI